MATLTMEDLESGTAQLSMDDLGQTTNSGVQLNSRTAAQLAAGEATITDPTPESFRVSRERIMDPELRHDFIRQQREGRAATHDDAKEVLLDTIADTSVTDEQKMQMSIGASFSGEEISSAVTSTLNTLAEEAVITDSGVNETEQAAESRNLMINSIDRVNRHKRDVMLAINSIAAGKDQGILGTLTDIGELMVPLAEWNHFDRLLKDVTGEREATMLGNQKQILFEEIMSFPIDERAKFTQDIIDLVQAHDTVVMPDGNDLITLETLERMLLDNDYSDGERWFDNITSVLDVIGVAQLFKGLTKAPKVAKAAGGADGLTGEILDPVTPTKPSGGPAAESGWVVDGEYTDVTDVASRARIEATRTEVAPTSPSQIVKDYNPEQARDMHAIAIGDESGEGAEALYGSSRTEAAAKDLLPEPAMKPDEVPNKVQMSRPIYEEPENIRRARLANGNTAVSEKEMGQVRQKVISGFEDIEGMRLHKESMVVRTNLDETLSITGRYSPRDSGFSSPSDALENAKFAFRNYGLQDEHFTIYARNGDKWVKTTQQEVDAKAVLKGAGAEDPALDDVDYMVGMEYDYRFRPEDMDEADLLTTGNPVTKTIDAFTARMGPASLGQGSVVQHLFDAASVVHPQIVNPASVATDRAFGLKHLYVDAFADFTSKYAGLSKERRAAMSDYINKANHEGIKFSPTDLMARGFDQEEIDALKTWRRANDAMWYAANEDMVNSLKVQGKKVLTHADSDTRLIGNPVPRGAVNSRTVMFDPVEGTNVSMSPEMLDQIYGNGGEVIRLSSAAEIDSQWVEFALSRNTTSGGYTRAIYEGETVLNYRDGYYPVMYDANWFVEMEIKLADGTVSTKVVASARNSADAKHAMAGLQKDQPDATFTRRKDRRLENSRDNLFDEGSWSISQSSGLTSQKVRGERLKDAGVDLHKSGNSNLKDPLEAVSNQIHQLSQRVSMRTYLDTVKNRWLLNYGKYMDLNVDPKSGQMLFPQKITSVNGKVDTPSKMVADARTNFNYITSMENGYINGIDASYKMVMNQAAKWAEELGLSKLEEGLFEAGKLNPIQKAKTLAFRLFISSNPGRQALIQRAQMLQLGAINPSYVAGNMAQDLVMIDMVRAGKSVDPHYVALFKEIQDVGVLEAVDAHTLIRDDLLRMADLSFGQKVRTKVAWPLNQLQKVGFDWAEQHVLVSAWLSFRDQALKAGRDIKNQRVIDDILGQARAYTLNMNRAGEMPYSQNTLGMAAQFFSFQHKALLQPIFNKSLNKREKAQLLAYTTVMYGVDASLLTVGYHAIWGDEPPSEARDLIEAGLLDTTLNAVLSDLSGEAQAIDFGDLAPTEAYGVGNVLVTMLTMGIGEGLAESPAGSLLFGGSSRIHQAFKTGLRYFYADADYENPEFQTTFADVTRASMGIFSGYSNAFKANYAYQQGRMMSSSGRISDSDVTAVEAMASSLGFRTKTEEGYRETLELIYGDATFGEDDIKDWYRDLKRHLARRGIAADEQFLQQRALNEAFRVFGNDRPKFNKVILSEMNKDAANSDFTMFTRIYKKMGLSTNEELWQMINTLPAGQTRERLVQLMETREEMLSGN